jgi:hypothetical protein
MRGKHILMWKVIQAGNYAGTGNLFIMLDFRWVRGKITRGRYLTFKGAGKVPAMKFYAGKVNAGNHPRTRKWLRKNKSFYIIICFLCKLTSVEV